MQAQHDTEIFVDAEYVFAGLDEVEHPFAEKGLIGHGEKRAANPLLAFRRAARVVSA